MNNRSDDGNGILEFQLVTKLKNCENNEIYPKKI